MNPRCRRILDGMWEDVIAVCGKPMGVVLPRRGNPKGYHRLLFLLLFRLLLLSKGESEREGRRTVVQACTRPRSRCLAPPRLLLLPVRRIRWHPARPNRSSPRRRRSRGGQYQNGFLLRRRKAFPGEDSKPYPPFPLVPRLRRCLLLFWFPPPHEADRLPLPVAGGGVVAFDDPPLCTRTIGKTPCSMAMPNGKAAEEGLYYVVEVALASLLHRFPVGSALLPLWNVRPVPSRRTSPPPRHTG